MQMLPAWEVPYHFGRWWWWWRWMIGCIYYYSFTIITIISIIIIIIIIIMHIVFFFFKTHSCDIIMVILYWNTLLYTYYTFCCHCHCDSAKTSPFVLVQLFSRCNGAAWTTLKRCSFCSIARRVGHGACRCVTLGCQAWCLHGFFSMGLCRKLPSGYD